MTGDDDRKPRAGNGNAAKQSAYTEQAAVRLEATKARLAQVRTRIKAAVAAGHGDRDEHLSKVEHQVDTHLATVERRLARLSEASAETWDGFRKELDSAWDDLARAVKNLISRA